MPLASVQGKVRSVLPVLAVVIRCLQEDCGVLTARLDADSLEEREACVKMLLERGEAVRAALTEAAARAREILRVLEVRSGWRGGADSCREALTRSREGAGSPGRPRT